MRTWELSRALVGFSAQPPRECKSTEKRATGLVWGAVRRTRRKGGHLRWPPSHAVAQMAGRKGQREATQLP
jgi:hypothetical protein